MVLKIWDETYTLLSCNLVWQVKVIVIYEVPRIKAIRLPEPFFDVFIKCFESKLECRHAPASSLNVSPSTKPWCSEYDLQRGRWRCEKFGEACDSLCSVFSNWQSEKKKTNEFCVQGLVYFCFTVVLSFRFPNLLGPSDFQGFKDDKWIHSEKFWNHSLCALDARKRSFWWKMSVRWKRSSGSFTEFELLTLGKCSWMCFNVTLFTEEVAGMETLVKKTRAVCSRMFRRVGIASVRRIVCLGAAWERKAWIFKSYWIFVGS